jgi:hypothetical protein
MEQARCFKLRAADLSSAVITVQLQLKITAYSQELELTASCFGRKHTATGKLWVFERLGFDADACKLRIVSSGS